MLVLLAFVGASPLFSTPTALSSRATHALQKRKLAPGEMKGVFIGKMAGQVTWPKESFKDKKTKLEVLFIGDDLDGIEKVFQKEIVAKKKTTRPVASGGRLFSVTHAAYAPLALNEDGKRADVQSEARLKMEKLVRAGHIMVLTNAKRGTLSKAETKRRTIELLTLARG